MPKGIYNRKIINKKHISKKHCRLCKNFFIPINSKQYLCSTKCRETYNSFDYKAINGVDDRKNGWLRLRFEVFKRDNFTCIYCGRNVKDDKIKLNCDHIIPKTKNGKDVLNNLVTSCFECNQGKKDVLLDARLTLCK
jgi:5-methylcytosine-specific restriction endonuclease McrA